MRTAESDKIFTVEEYIQYELKSERRHEFINGQLFEMLGEKDIKFNCGNYLCTSNYIFKGIFRIQS